MKFVLMICIACCFLSGCASVVARAYGEPYMYYHGTQLDARHAFDKPLSPILLLDLPFSFVADTLLLPVDLIYSPYCGIMTAHNPNYPPEPQCEK
ncbi:YceK/YidQ family lipoprotein [Salmonella enterica subsp. enterica serovar Okatie]|nr:YceK/YidQ family lipoprotein [Salmonella enterica subsp. enterica serovar Okatie]